MSNVATASRCIPNHGVLSAGCCDLSAARFSSGRPSQLTRDFVIRNEIQLSSKVTLGSDFQSPRRCVTSIPRISSSIFTVITLTFLLPRAHNLGPALGHATSSLRKSTSHSTDLLSAIRRTSRQQQHQRVSNALTGTVVRCGPHLSMVAGDCFRHV